MRESKHRGGDIVVWKYTCCHCGANLDSGEKCDCQEELKKKQREIAECMRTEPDGQMVLIMPTLKRIYR